MTKARTVKQLSERDHVLKRESMYIGSIRPNTHEALFLEDEKFVYKEYDSVDGLLKIINEIIDNSIDEALTTNFEHSNQIWVTLDDDVVKIEDNGRGIPVELDPDTGIWQPVLAFTAPRAGSNFEDEDEDRMTIGLNGVGSFGCNVFSKKFYVDTKDGQKRCILECKNNLESYNFKISDCIGKTGTYVRFYPDLERFGLEKIDDLHKSLIEQRLIHLSMSYPQIQFKYNRRVVKIRNTKKYLNAFADTYEHIETDKYLIAILPNEENDFRQSSYVNGLHMEKAGTHIDYIVGEVRSRLRQKIQRQFKGVKPGDIKSKMRVVAVLREFPNCKFDSQTKVQLTNSYQDIRDYLGDIDWDRFAKKIIKNEEIYDPIIETYKLKEELKKRRLLKNADKELANKKVKCEKYYAPIKDSKYLVLAEGDSAANLIMKVLGRSQFGFFAMRGVPLNAFEVLPTKLAKNIELKNIMGILGLSYTTKETPLEEINFENVLLAQDADADGAHIAGLLIGFFKKYAPSMLINGKIQKLLTPLIVLKSKRGKKAIEKFFFTLDEFQEFEKNNDISKYTLKYYKGLGSWRDTDLKELIQNFGLETFIVPLIFDESASELMNDWLAKGKDSIEKRKAHLSKHEFSIFDV